MTDKHKNSTHKKADAGDDKKTHEKAETSDENGADEKASSKDYRAEVVGARSDVRHAKRDLAKAAVAYPESAFLGIDQETGDAVFNITVDSQKPDPEKTEPVNLDALNAEAYSDPGNAIAHRLADHAYTLVEDLTEATEANNILQHVIGERDNTIDGLRAELAKSRTLKQLAIV